jgi:hypothetical protein
VRLAFSLAIIALLSACAAFSGVPPASDMLMGAGAVGLMYGDDIANMKKEDVTLKNATPPQAKSTTTRVATQIRDNVHATGKHLKDWWFYDPAAHVEAKTVPNSYCYKTQGDVLCYRAPMPGWENRLVGYQGTYAEAPPPVMMQPLPTKTVDARMLPENRIANAKPVFTSLPPEVKEEPAKDPAALLETDPQDVHETIADPTVSPQL